MLRFALHRSPLPYIQHYLTGRHVERAYLRFTPFAAVRVRALRAFCVLYYLYILPRYYARTVCAVCAVGTFQYCRAACHLYVHRSPCITGDHFVAPLPGTLHCTPPPAMPSCYAAPARFLYFLYAFLRLSIPCLYSACNLPHFYAVSGYLTMARVCCPASFVLFCCGGTAGALYSPRTPLILRVAFTTLRATLFTTYRRGAFFYNTTLLLLFYHFAHTILRYTTTFLPMHSLYWAFVTWLLNH